MKNVTIIGAGNGGLTAAYHLVKNGHNVCIYDSPSFDTQIKAVKAKGGIEALAEDHGCQMMLPGFSKIAKATTDIKEAVEFADVLLMICPTFAQELLFESLVPHLKDGQTLVLMPGNYGGFVLNKKKKEMGYGDLKITFIDAMTIPWACRITSPGVITIMGLKEYVGVSIFSENMDTKKAETAIKEIMPIAVEILANPLVSGLENINFGGHPLLTVLNMGLLENFGGDYNYYKDCCSTATANAAAKMDLERLSVGKAYKINLKTELDAMNALYNSDYKTVYEFNRASTTHGKINSAPANSQARYITEDVPFLLVPCYELAKKAGIKLPIVESCIHIASAYNDTDYFETGRTLAKMGIDTLSIEEMIAQFGRN